MTTIHPYLEAQTCADTPLGPITLAATARGLAGLWFDGQKHHPGALDAPVDAGQRWIAQTLAELSAYWRGEAACLAASLGRPEAVRAVAAAVGRNPVSILVPCHRVLGRDGSLTGYAGGVERKAALLELEGATKPVRLIEGAPA